MSAQNASNLRERPWSAGEVALICMYFCAEDETFGVFREWAREQAETARGSEWAKSLTLEELRRLAIHARNALERMAFPADPDIWPVP